jgi:hypothetical protein
MKKIFIILILMATTFVACDDDEQFWEIGNFNLQFLDKNGTPVSADSTNTPQLYIYMEFNPVYSAILKSNTDLIQKAYAASPQGDYIGLKHSISKLIITSNNDFNGIKAGEDISSKLVYCGQASTTQNCANITISNFIFNELKQEQPVLYSATFRFTEKPVRAKHKFTFRFIDSQGKEFVSSTKEIIWK